MADYTKNLNLEKPLGGENFRRQVFNDNMDKVDAAVGERISRSQLDTYLTDMNAIVAGGTGNAITLTMPSVISYTPMQKLTFIAASTNASTSKTINVNSLGALPFYKPNTTTSPVLTAGKAYTVWLDATGTTFFLQVSAEGNAVANLVLAGLTFSNDLDTGIVGTMPYPGTVTITPGTVNQVIPAGFHTGGGMVLGSNNLIAGNIRSGVNIFGVVGTYSKNYAEDTIARFNIDSHDTVYTDVTVGFAPSLVVLFVRHDDAAEAEWSITARVSGYSVPVGFDSRDAQIPCLWSGDREEAYMHISSLGSNGFTVRSYNDTGLAVETSIMYWIAIG